MRAGGDSQAGREKKSKSDHALDIVRRARERGMRFEWVGSDAGYGKEPAFLRALDDANEVFVADLHCNQRVWTEEPGLYVPEPTPGRGRPSKKQRAAATPITVEKLAKGFLRGTGRAASCATARAVNCKSIRAPTSLGLGWRGITSAVLASDRPARGLIGQDDQIQPVERSGRYAAAPTGADPGHATGLSALSKTPKASAAWPTIRRWVGDPGITTSRSSCWRCCSSSNSAWPNNPASNC